MSKEQGSESAVSGSQFIKKEEEMAEEKEAPKRVSRRQFVKGAAAVAGVGALASCAPPATPAPGETAAPAPTCPPAGECPPAATPWIPAKWDYEADVVVLGVGFAGQAAAIEAADLGASVLALEKSPREHAGGNSFANYFWDSAFIGLNVEDSIKYVTSECWGSTPDEEVIRAVVEAEFELPAWHESYGAIIEWSHTNSNCLSILNGDKMGTGEDQLNRFNASPPEEWFTRYPKGEGKSPWQEWIMEEVFPAKGINVMCSTPATQLIQDGATGEILGVKALEGVTFTDWVHYTGGKEIYIKAKKGVVLATGGYQNNHEILANYAPHPHSSVPPSGYLTFYGSPYLTGDGMTMATKVGAKGWHFNKKETHNFASVVASKELEHGVEVKAWAAKIEVGPGIIVNREGKRFYNEYHYGGHSDNRRPWDEFRQKVAEFDDSDYCDYPNIPFYWIFDDTTMKAGPLGSPKGSSSKFSAVLGDALWTEDNAEELAKGWFVQADTIE
ncbi:MAG: FAD-binding protein, partial [Dehalococcoidales bacterium]|nr:FAD-binding protein [Dehalococcoidales bacterium]